MKKIKVVSFAAILFAILLSTYSCKHNPDPVPNPNPTNEDSCLVTPSITIDSIGHAACGNAAGMILVSGSGGTGAGYTYSLDGNTFQASDTFQTIAAGTYTISIKDSVGCIGVSSQVIIQNITGMNVTLSSSPAACSSANGSIDVTNVTGGVGPFTYSIDGTTFGSATTFSSLGVGSYTISVKDSTGCVATKDISIADNGNVAFTTDTTNPDCGLTNGIIQFHTTAGDAPFQFSIDNGGSFQNDSLFSALTAGSYDLLVEDSSGCQSASVMVLTENASTLDFTATTGDAACNTSDGTITVNATGGVGGYMYSINGGALSGTNVFSSLAAGNHNVTVQDGNTCETTKQVTVSTTSVSYSTQVAPILSATCSSVSCHGTPSLTKPDLTGHSAASTVAVEIKSELQAGTMPKTGSISASDKALIICWIDEGAPNN